MSQGEVQAIVRAATSKALSWPGDWHALFDQDSIAAGTFNERMRAWLNYKMGTSYASLSAAQQAYALLNNAVNWSSLSTFSLGPAGSAATLLLGSETQGLALDFTDSYWQATTGRYGSARIIDTGTPANNFDSDPYTKLTYTSPSAKMTLGPAGTLRFGAHNLLLQSQTFDNASWSPNSITVTANTDVAPDGTTTADTLTATSADAFIVQTISSLVVGASYRFQVWLKAGTASSVRIYSITPTAFTACSLTSSWQLFTLDFTATGTGSNFQIGGGSSFNSGTIKVWGAQLTRTPCDTTYLATTSAARYALPYEWNTSGTLQGILVEESRTNALLRSEDFSTTWAAISTSGVTTDAIAAPDGNITADLLTEAAAGSGSVNHGRTQSVSLATNATYTFSLYAKAGTRSFIRLVIADDVSGTNQVRAWFNLGTGAVGTVGNVGTATGATASIQSVGNGWYRCILTGQPASVSTAVVVSGPRINTADAETSYTGNGSSGIYAWGAQLEAGSFATSYIPTIGATATRAADNISLATSAFPASNTTQTLYANTLDCRGFAAQFDNGSGTQRLLELSCSLTTYDYYGGGGTFAVSTPNSDSERKWAAAIAANDAAGVYKGGAPSTDNTVTVGQTLATLYIGTYTGSAAQANGYIKKLMALPRRMTNAELQSVTS